MPLLWRYLIQCYLKSFWLALAVILLLLFALFLDELAHFACLGASSLDLLRYLLWQLPFLLPIALPVAAVIAAHGATKKLSCSSELLAMRAAGLGVKRLLAPFWCLALLLGVVNFLVGSELATRAHLAHGLLKEELRTINPLLLLGHKQLLGLYGLHFESQGKSRHGQYIEEGFLALPDPKQKRLHLFVAKELRQHENGFAMERATLIHAKAQEEGYDELTVENVANSSSAQALFAPLLRKKSWKIQPDHLCLPWLLRHLHRLEGSIQRLMADPSKGGAALLEQAKQNRSRLVSDLFRRLALGLCVVTLTVAGVAFGMEPPRAGHWRARLPLMLIGIALLFSYFLAKASDGQPLVAASLYLLPHLIALCICCRRLERIERGCW